MRINDKQSFLAGIRYAAMFLEYRGRESDIMQTCKGVLDPKLTNAIISGLATDILNEATLRLVDETVIMGTDVYSFEK